MLVSCNSHALIQKFQSYFGYNLVYLDGGVESGFNVVEPTVEKPNMYKIKGTEKGMSMTQVPLEKSSLNKGDSFILYANPSKVWLWHGESANPDEKARANQQAEEMCTQGTVVTMDQGDGDQEHADFWAYLADGEIQEADEGDEDIEEFTPLLFHMPEGGEPNQIAKAEPVKVRFGRPAHKLDRSLLDENDVFLLDAGWEVYLWMGKNSDRSEKFAAMNKADGYMVSALAMLSPVYSGQCFLTTIFLPFFLE